MEKPYLIFVTAAKTQYFCPKCKQMYDSSKNDVLNKLEILRKEKKTAISITCEVETCKQVFLLSELSVQ